MDNNSYSVVLCDTDISKHINYQIRYQVYCLEAGYEAVNKYPNQIETDLYDEFSVHFLIRDNNMDKWIGACRLIILPFDELPLLQHCPIDDISFYQQLPNSAEISRLCVVTSSRNGTWSMLTMMLNVIYQYCLNNNIQHCFSLHNKAMSRVVHSLNIHAQAISHECEFRGKRRAYYHHITPNYVDKPQYQLYSEYKRRHKFIPNNYKKKENNYTSR